MKIEAPSEDERYLEFCLSQATFNLQGWEISQNVWNRFGWQRKLKVIWVRSSTLHELDFRELVEYETIRPEQLSQLHAYLANLGSFSNSLSPSTSSSSLPALPPSSRGLESLLNHRSVALQNGKCVFWNSLKLCFCQIRHQVAILHVQINAEAQHHATTRWQIRSWNFYKTRSSRTHKEELRVLI